MAEESDIGSFTSTSYEESFEEDSSDGIEDDIEEEVQKSEDLSVQKNSQSTELDTEEISAKRTEQYESLIQEEVLKDEQDTVTGDNESDEDEEDIKKLFNDEEKQTTTNSSIKLSSKRPSDFNGDDYAFHFDFFRQPRNIPNVNEKKYKNGTRKSLSFSNERMREIERHNRILLSKIVAVGPSHENYHKKSQSFTKSNDMQQQRVSSAAINRKKQQQKIDYENQILKRKIEAIAIRKTRFN